MEEEGPGSDKLKPYKKDLEYLDDHFQLISYKVKIKLMDMKMEMEVCIATMCRNVWIISVCVA